MHYTLKGHAHFSVCQNVALHISADKLFLLERKFSHRMYKINDRYRDSNIERIDILHFQNWCYHVSCCIQWKLLNYENGGMNYENTQYIIGSHVRINYENVGCLYYMHPGIVAGLHAILTFHVLFWNNIHKHLHFIPFLHIDSWHPSSWNIITFLFS